MVDTNMIILTAIWLLVAPKIDVAAVDPCYLNTSSCTPVTTSFCLGAKISFTHTSLIFANDSSDLTEVERNLAQWSLLQRVPECWSVIQPFLCSVYLPKCDLGEEKVELPSKELCERTRGPCKVVQQYNGEWPDFLRCDAGFFKSACGVSQRSNLMGARWLSGRMLDSRRKDRGFEPHRRHCVVSLSKTH